MSLPSPKGLLHRFKTLGLIALGLAFLFISWATRTGKMDPRPYGNTGKLIPVATGTPAAAESLTLGIYVEKLYDFAVQTESISAEGWLWLTWPQSFQDRLEVEQIPLSQLVLGSNVLGATDPAVVPRTEKPIKLPDGRYHQIFSFQGRFAASGLDFRRFPFQTVRFPLTFSLNPENASLNAGQVRLVPDREQSGLGYYTGLPGYVVTGQKLTELITQFPTHFGLPEGTAARATQFSTVRMEVIYHTSVVAAFLQLFLPLIVVMAVVLLTPALAGSLWDVRIALPSTALLTLIFLQQGYRSQLPSLPYLTFIDQVYALCYATALIIFALCVWSSNQLDQATPANRAEVIERINRVDRRFQIGLTIALIVMITLSLLVPVRYPGY